MLHIVNKSPFERNSLDACLRLAEKGSSILFIEDGIYGALDNTSVADSVKAAMADHDLYVLSADLKVRGVDGRVVDGVTVVDYDGFVDLVVEKGPSNSWL
ncbi:sulfurtransferase complex subunit TusB [Magnetospira sp. QH-2]|uniref:sulfurtransferase complex subunit TusB n=1 Tax=Magnetospira sp. (strain QH-2) TaxID=1288970 RepID=UPI0003E80D87|nr:sulfurtransferase complex subunit TusB [Magnetospira sp. QH-2]CCQ74006.1 Intracellular sulfur oxidation protein DsrH/TusB [Magnetospira sp. QH-2]